MKQSVLVSGWSKIFKRDEIKENLPTSHFDEEDDMPIAILYSTATRSSMCTGAEILELAEGANEDSREVNIFNEDINDDVRDDMVQKYDNCNVSADIMGLNDTLQWAENGKLSLAEILLLRKIKEKVVQEKIAC